MSLAKSILKAVRRGTIFLIAVLLSFAFLLFWLFFAKMPFNDLLFRYMSHTLAVSVQHPSKSQVIERYDFFGSRYTDITECTYEVGEIRSSSLTPEEVLGAYNNNSTLLAGQVHTIIINQNTLFPIDDPAVNWIVEFRENATYDDTNTYYLVYLYKPGMSGLGDIRCFD